MSVSALNVWLRVQATLWLSLLAATALHSGQELPVGWRTPAVGLLLASLLSLIAVLGAVRKPADIATIVRGLGLVAASWMGLELRDWTWWALVVLVVLGDLVDGWLARRFGGTPQGAVLDMETDQLTILALSALFVLAGGGVHTLVLPALRYIFVLAMWLLGAPAHDPKPVNGDNRRGRRICAAVVVSLILAHGPHVPMVVGNLGTAIAVALLCWSYSSDTRHLLQHARRPKVAA
jgi:phosphatidylglycerophosphate synthase